MTRIFIRELSPVLTAIIVAVRVRASFTAELATMTITQQISVLYTLSIDPIIYLIIPRFYACICILSILNFFAMLTSLFTSIFVSYLLYNIQLCLFLDSSYAFM